jgi:hypothetical protein
MSDNEWYRVVPSGRKEGKERYEKVIKFVLMQKVIVLHIPKLFI